MIAKYAVPTADGAGSQLADFHAFLSRIGGKIDTQIDDQQPAAKLAGGRVATQIADHLPVKVDEQVQAIWREQEARFAERWANR